MIYGYARVSTRKQGKDGNSLEAQIEQLKNAGAEKIFVDTYTGKKMERPEFNKLLKGLKDNEDEIVITKLDRFARSLIEASDLISSLLERGIAINILNGLGYIDNSPMSKFTVRLMLLFAEFERDLIIERTTEGREMRRLDPNYKEGRPRKFTKAQLDLAMDLLEQHSYTAVSEMTGISKSTIQREYRKREAGMLFTS